MVAYVSAATEQAVNNYVPLIVSNTFQVTNLTANGATFRAIVAGQALPSLSGVVSPVGVSVLVGNTGWTSDAVLISTVCPAGMTGIPPVVPVQAGAFAVEFLVTLRANSKTAGSPNLVFSAVGIDPVAVVSSPATNGNVNVVSTVTTTNIANISLMVTCGSGQNANVLVQHASIMQLA